MLAAGSITHFIVAILLIWMVLVAIGIGTGQVTTTIDNTVALDGGQRSPAQIAGLRSGDQSWPWPACSLDLRAAGLLQSKATSPSPSVRARR